VDQFLLTFRDYPQRQKAASFNMDEVMQKLKETQAACGRPTCFLAGRSVGTAEFR
jgi:hypothetical protein